jgi:two-component system phosphate regulon response regulator OmpR
MNKRDFFVVVVEDDDSLRSEVAHLVASVGFRTREASCAEELDEIAVDSVPSLLVLDIGLPGEDGLSICRRYTESIPGLTAVVLTARAGQEDRIDAYRSGAVLFLAKPFDGDELLAIIEGQWRARARQGAGSRNAVSLRGAHLEGPRGVVLLTAAEARLIGAFAVSSGRTLEAYRIAELIASRDSDAVSKAAIELSISRLRSKLRQVSEETQPIRSIYRYGYKLVPAIELS